MTVVPTRGYSLALEMPNLLYTAILKKVPLYPFQVEPPRVVHYREYLSGERE